MVLSITILTAFLAVGTTFVLAVPIAEAFPNALVARALPDQARSGEHSRRAAGGGLRSGNAYQEPCMILLCPFIFVLLSNVSLGKHSVSCLEVPIDPQIQEMIYKLEAKGDSTYKDNLSQAVHKLQDTSATDEQREASKNVITKLYRENIRFLLLRPKIYKLLQSNYYIKTKRGLANKKLLEEIMEKLQNPSTTAQYIDDREILVDQMTQEKEKWVYFFIYFIDLLSIF
ncbi:hypothetical protein J3R30DRAFT_3406857 [Lentinula aciculospora]|uniref:Uncharacterized protein n=1 Tax=Lentinula aciculospora TaxID=153920 RepID=A0A9W9A582_9AGAR|nr:hypothetical protein J3R30DRAFT_3406857 [Lentinula aciculospora]